MTTTSFDRHVVFLDGPIGVGKTTLGRALAAHCAGVFLDGDDYSEAGKPWFASSLSTSRRILKAATAGLEMKPIVVVAYPMRCINWVFFRSHLEVAGVGVLCIGLQAPHDNIISGGRSHRLSAGEIKRSRQMALEGYGARPFNQFDLRTDEASVTELARRAVAKLAGGGLQVPLL